MIVCREAISRGVADPDQIPGQDPGACACAFLCDRLCVDHTLGGCTTAVLVSFELLPHVPAAVPLFLVQIICERAPKSDIPDIDKKKSVAHSASLSSPFFPSHPSVSACIRPVRCVEGLL